MNEKRKLNHSNLSGVHIQHDFEFASAVYYQNDCATAIYFLRTAEGEFKEAPSGGSYMQVAIEKCDKIKEDRHLINYDLLASYRWAIREAFNHQLDRSLKNLYDQPRHRNTIKGVKDYIKRIEAASKQEMQKLEMF